MTLLHSQGSLCDILSCFKLFFLYILVAPHDCCIFRYLALKPDMKHTKTKHIRNVFFVTSLIAPSLNSSLYI